MLLFFIGGTLWVMPISLFVFDNDEGINVMKAVLLADGYPLYTQTWSDQPPVFTQLLQWTFALFGERMLVARLLVLALSTIFIWAYTSTIQLHLGTAAAWVALFLLMLSDNFLRLSVSVMIGLPALTFAMVALYLLQRYKQTGGSWLLLVSGLLMGISLQTKLFTVLLIPILGLDLLDYGRDLGGDRTRFWGKLGRTMLWGVLILVVYGLIGFYYQAFDLYMLLGAHLKGDVQSAYADEGGWSEIRRFLLFDYGHLLLALLGVLAIGVRRLWHGLLPLGWLVLAMLFLLYLRPMWYHHYQLLAIPLCWLAAYLVPLLGLEARLARLRTTAAPIPLAEKIPIAADGLLLTVVALVALGLLYLRGQAAVPYYNQRPDDQAIVALLQADAAPTQWVFTDKAIYPFYAGLRVPPEIAVFSRKRFFGHTLNNAILLTVMEQYHPEQLLLTRFKDDLLAAPEFVAYLDAHYTKVQETGEYAYYRLRE